MSTHHAVLGLLAFGERHGYEMRRELEDLDRGWRLEHGQLYRLLARLERDGWVRSRTGPGEGGPSRKLYRLTKPGRSELETWLADLDTAVREARDELPLKLRLGRAMGAPGLLELIAARRGDLEEELRELRRQAASCPRSGDPDRWLVIDSRCRHLDASLEALFAYRHELEEESRPQAAMIEAAGSDDPILDLLARYLSAQDPPVSFSSRPLGSLGGLLRLREGRAHLAGTHLLDVETGEFNAPFIKGLLFEEPVLLVNLAHREQGLMVAAGRSRRIAGVEDLLASEVRFINRQRGAGTRLLLRTTMLRAGLEPRDIKGYDSEAPTHEAVARAVAEGAADAGLGIRAVAEEWGLVFIPVARERFDLAVCRSVYESSRLEPVWAALEDAAFREDVGSRPGYDIEQMGRVVAEVRG